MLKDLPPFDCLLEGAAEFPSLDPTAFEAFLHLLRTGDDVFEAEEEFLTRHRISHGRFMVLVLLQWPCAESNTPAELADAARVSRATMTGLIDTLERDRLVVRKSAVKDRRTIQVFLTAQGKSLINKMLPDYFRRVSNIISPLSGAERKQLVRLLQKIQKGLAESSSARERKKTISKN